MHRYGEWSEGLRLGWENTDEDVITPQAAITAFGLTAISEGLIKVLNESSSVAILKGELEDENITRLCRRDPHGNFFISCANNQLRKEC